MSGNSGQDLREVTIHIVCEGCVCVRGEVCVVGGEGVSRGEGLCVRGVRGVKFETGDRELGSYFCKIVKDDLLFVEHIT